MKNKKRIPVYCSLTETGLYELALIKQQRGYRHNSDAIEAAIHDKASRIPKKDRVKLQEEQSMCPYAGMCADIHKLLKNGDLQAALNQLNIKPT